MARPLTITAHRFPVSIAAAEVARRRDAAARTGSDPFAPESCPSCGADACYRVRGEWRGDELLVVHYHCGHCNKRYEDYLD